MAAMSLAKAALRYGEQFMGHLVAFKALELLRGEIFRALIPRSPRVSTTSRSGDLLARATKDVDRIEVFFAHTFAPMVSAVVVPATVLVLIGARVSWAAAGVAGIDVVAEPALTELAHADSRKAARKVVSDVLRHRDVPVALCTHRPVLPSVMEVISRYAPGKLLRSVPDRDPWLKTGEIMVVHLARRPRGRIRAVAIEKQRPVLSEGR